MATAWNPTAEPFRVVWSCRSGHLPHGWATTVRTFASEPDALAAMNALFPAGVMEARVDRAENAHDWQRSGRWRQIASRKRGRRNGAEG